MDWQKQIADFKSGLKVEKPAMVTPFIRFAFFGMVGSGKSVTSGICAVGIAQVLEPKCLIGWIDGEGRRSGYAIGEVSRLASEKYGGTVEHWKNERFRVVHIDPPFDPLRVVAAFELLEEQGCKLIIADCMTQVWDSDGGYLDLRAEEIERRVDAAKGRDGKPLTEDEKDWKRNSSSAAASATVKRWTHGKLVNKVNAIQCHLILVFQAKAKWNAKEKTVNEFVTPIQESGLTRLMLAVGRVDEKMVGDSSQGGFCSFSGAIGQGMKFTIPALLKILPQNGQQFTFAHAEALARWANGSSNAPTVQPANGDVKALKRQLWEMTMETVHFGKLEKLKSWLVDENILPPDKPLDDLTASELQAAIAKVKGKI